MENLPSLPKEILGSIFSSTDLEPKELALVSKEWNRAIQTALAYLFLSYEKNPSLRLYTAHSKQIMESNITEDKSLRKVKFVFQRVMENAQQMGYPQELPAMKNLSVAHLQQIDNWAKGKEAENFIIFAVKIASDLPIMQEFLEHIQDLSSLEKAEKIEQWMQKNSDAFSNVLKLNLKKMNLTTLPKQIKYFQNLEILSLENNHLTSIPVEIGSLSKLKELYLEKNKLTAFPIEIASLNRLTILFLSRNRLSIIPNQIGSLTELHNLSLDNNQLKGIPYDEIASLPKLEWVTLGGNPFHLPKKIGLLVDQGGGFYS